MRQMRTLRRSRREYGSRRLAVPGSQALIQSLARPGAWPPAQFDCHAGDALLTLIRAYGAASDGDLSGCRRRLHRWSTSMQER